MDEQMEPRSADAGFLSGVLYAAVAVLYAQVLQVQRSSLLSVALTPRAPPVEALVCRALIVLLCDEALVVVINRTNA